jgi:hypothetical protein
MSLSFLFSTTLCMIISEIALIIVFSKNHLLMLTTCIAVGATDGDDNERSMNLLPIVVANSHQLSQKYYQCSFSDLNLDSIIPNWQDLLALLHAAATFEVNFLYLVEVSQEHGIEKVYLVHIDEDTIAKYQSVLCNAKDKFISWCYGEHAIENSPLKEY